MLGKIKTEFKIIKRSNIVQYDEMGYPLRLCIVKDGDTIDHRWLDSYDQEGDIELKWEDA